MMIRSILPALLLLTACSAKDPSRTINATIGGAGGKMLYLDKFAGNKPVHIDSLKLDAAGSAPATAGSSR